MVIFSVEMASLELRWIIDQFISWYQSMTFHATISSSSALISSVSSLTISCTQLTSWSPACRTDSTRFFISLTLKYSSSASFSLVMLSSFLVLFTAFQGKCDVSLKASVMQKERVWKEKNVFAFLYTRLWIDWFWDDLFSRLYKKFGLDKWKILQRTTLLEQLIANNKIWTVIEASDGGYYCDGDHDDIRAHGWTWRQISPTPPSTTSPDLAGSK